MKRTAAERTPPPAPIVRKPLVLAGHEAIVDRLVVLNATLDGAKVEIEAQRAKLDAAAVALAAATETATGHACKSMQAIGSTINGRYTFTDRYTAVDPDSAPELEAVLGATFEKLFGPSQTIKIKPDTGGRLLELLRKHGCADEFLSVDPCIKPVEEFRELRAALRRTLSRAQNEALDRVVDQIAARPQLSLK